MQPIELIWAYVKGIVASQYTLNRTLDQTREQTDDAFDTVTSGMIQKRIKRCHKWIDRFLQTEEAGSLQAFSSLDNLIAATSQQQHPSDIDAVCTEEVESDTEEEDESS